MRLSMTVSLDFTFGILVAVAALILLVWNTGDVAHGATITVTKFADTEGTCTPTDCSLREALASATAGDGIDVGFGVYTLTLGKALKITTSLTMTGDTIIIQGDPAPLNKSFRLLDITGGDVRIGGDVVFRNGGGIKVGAGATLTLTEVTIRDVGEGQRGAGTLTLTDVTIRDNKTARFINGGGIYNDGTVTLVNTDVKDNIAYDFDATEGGGIFNSTTGALTLINSTVRNNLADDNGGGIRNYGTVTMTYSTVSDNHADDHNGGGIRNSGAMIITGSTFSGNSSRNEGAASIAMGR